MYMVSASVMSLTSLNVIVIGIDLRESESIKIEGYALKTLSSWKKKYHDNVFK